MARLSRILVVEDEVLLLLDLIDNLALRGFDVVPVSTARDAVSLLDTDIDALITDIELPGAYHGLQLARLAADQRPGLPIIVVSGGVRPSEGQLPAGANFFPKPYRITDILAALERRRSALAA
ncbi:response regulator [Devosia faecipullorum]|uniref:response regulator n=1 Tax=Devosia faecipullorum TaxID=2755039 RepID=UPI00187B687E|nr:response regulator [Devosia faecipullorum]MBE7732363.1 response regulator [Devosia faecipullorum]